ncbi:protein FAR1-RELATED SEQUENCE 7-like [Telopea speciosissima]|uniref:protein FAR1-RELATED SEQUENCE 7-like n=1 Tax=Telopea speciosissima TaxID=54955 RepID=UPI001CC45CDF|nr:protein FAR1-RELATED SEQUENCE 7-like [Telopea speciosissima]
METNSESSSDSNYSMDEECNIGDSMSTKGKQTLEEVNNAIVSEEAKELGYEVPSINMEFDSTEQAYEFYNSYAQKIDFSIRKGRLEKTQKGVTQQTKFVCSKEGYRQVDKRTRNVKKSCPITRIGCEA